MLLFFVDNHQTCIFREEEETLTHALEFFLEISEVLALGDAEVVIGIVSLVHSIRRCGGADGKHGGRTLGLLSLADLFDQLHRHVGS